MSAFDAWVKEGGGGTSGTVPVYPSGSLPTPTAGLIAKLSDGNRGLVFANGTTWAPVETLRTFMFEDFGGKSADSSSGTRTANNAAWDNLMLAIGALNDTNHPQARVTFAESAKYFFAGPIHMRHPIRLEGVMASSGFNQNLPGSSGTSLMFPPGDRAVVIDYDPNAITGYGAGSSLSYLQVFPDTQTLAEWQANHLYAAGAVICPVGSNGPTFLASTWGGYCFVNKGSAGTSAGSQPSWPQNMTSPGIVDGQTIADGGVTWTAVLCPLIDVRAPAYFTNVFAGTAYGDGWRFWGDTTDSIADLCQASNCWAYNNRSNGVLVIGNDGNANLFTNLSTVGNGGWGIYDIGFLGNRYVNIHIADNGATPWGPLAVLALGGNYSARVQNGFEFTVTTAGTTGGTEPSWNTTIGATTNSGSAVFTCVRAWSGGPYYSDGSAVFGFYMEGGQLPAHNGSSGIIVGGSFGSGDTTFDSTSSGFLIESTNSVSPFFDVKVSSDPTYDATLVVGDRNGNVVWNEYLLNHKGNVSYDSIIAEFNSGITYLGFRNGSTGTASLFLPFGNALHGADSPAGFPNGISFNNPSASSEIFMRAAVAVPSTGAWLTGSIVWNTQPVQVGGYIQTGWICIAGGSPGTWLPINAAIGNSSTNIESLIASVVVDTALTTKQTLYTVPAGKSLIVTKYCVRSASGGATTVAGSTGFNAGATDVGPSGSLTFPTTTGSYVLISNVPDGTGATPPRIGTAASVLGFKTTVTDTITATIDTFGYLF